MQSRILQTKKDTSLYQGTGRAAQEGRSVSGRVVFDALGRTVAQYYPSVDGGNTTAFYPAVDSVTPTRTEYDVLDRSVRIILPDGSETVTEYSFGADRNGQTQAMTTVVDAEDNRKRTYKDARQLITSVQEQLIDAVQENQTLWTSYAYDAMKQIKKVIDAQGNITKVAYDNLGRRLSIDSSLSRVHALRDIRTSCTLPRHGQGRDDLRPGRQPDLQNHRQPQSGRQRRKAVTAHRLSL